MTDGIPNESGDDLAKRRRVLELTEDIADLLKDVSERFVELKDIGLTTLDVVDMVMKNFDPSAANKSALPGELRKLFHQGTPMEKVIERLFAEAPKLENADGTPVEGQAPALQCHIMLRPGGVITGALSQTPEGTLRMLTPTEIPEPGTDPRQKRMKTVLAEQFFDVDDVVAVVLQREVSASPGSGLISS